MTTNNAALANNPALPKDTSVEAIRARLAAVCSEFDLPYPKLKVIKGQIHITDDLVAWFKETGMSFDWVLCDTIMPMVRVFRREALQEKELIGLVRKFEKEETALLNEALAGWQEKVKALRSQNAQAVADDIEALPKG